jgi:undecaprenyl diphosphate synthase
MNPVKHVAIIMDGNGRWGIKYKKSRNAGHRAGLNTVDLIINQCIHHKIEILTLYTFSSENWKRPKNEITFLFRLLENFLRKKIDEIIKKNIKLKFIGELGKLPTKLQKLIKLSEKKTINKDTLQINIALNYGSKTELINTVKKIIQKKIIINEKSIDNNLYTKHLPNPDILIRTGDTHRLSNFLLWQLSYTEIFFEKKLWPDFTGKDFNKIINKFKNIKRNFGSIK